jgi:hypothetical protein
MRGRRISLAKAQRKQRRIWSQGEADFPVRMFVYHYFIFDMYNRQVVSLAILGDGDSAWMPQSFGYERWGCELRLRFTSVKLLQFAELEPVLATQPDPIAAVVQAHLATLAEPRDPMSLFARERRIIRSLYERGFEKQTGDCPRSHVELGHEEINQLACISWRPLRLRLRLLLDILHSRKTLTFGNGVNPNDVAVGKHSETWVEEHRRKKNTYKLHGIQDLSSLFKDWRIGAS